MPRHFQRHASVSSKKMIRNIGLTLVACISVGCATTQLPEYNPKLEWLYSGDLHKEIRRATRLRVRDSGTSNLSIRPGKTLIECTTKSELREVLKHLRFKQVNHQWYCMCAGRPTFEWYDGTNLVAEVGLHHGQQMRWPNHWNGDADLTSESSDWLVDWLDQHGVREPKKDLESSRRAANKTNGR
jgi:hypothetical protein